MCDMSLRRAMSSFGSFGASPVEKSIISYRGDKMHPVAEELQIQVNGDLDGYHFSVFCPDFIHREKLPSGSATFRQVLEEIEKEIQVCEVPEKPSKIPRNKLDPRRKSMAPRKFESNQRRVHWAMSTGTTSFQRQRVHSDGAVIQTVYRK